MKKSIRSLLIALLVNSSLAIAQPVLKVAAVSQTMVWSGVAVNGADVYVSGPRWAATEGPSVARLGAHGELLPYPSKSWNAWKAGEDPRGAFVNVNAIHTDSTGGLWVVDTGAPTFGGDPLPGGAKLVKIDLKTHSVSRVYPLEQDVALPGSYVDDIRFNGPNAYLTDAGRPGLIILNISSGHARRVLNGHSAATARTDRDIIMSGKILRTADQKPLHVNSDPLELSPDKKWLYFGPLEGPWSKIETRYLDDASLSEDRLATHVEPWADLPPTGGTSMDSNGDLYFSDLATDSLKKRASDGTISLVVRDPRLHWVDGSVIDEHHRIWLPVPQLDRAAVFNDKKSQVEWPIRLYVFDLSKAK